MAKRVRATARPARASPLVVVIDEFQYLADDERGLATVASELNAAWERRRAPRSILLVLAGSIVTTMEALAGDGAPLHGRFHWRQRLEPFHYAHAAEMVAFPSPRERIEAYATFGGTPRYLAAVDPSSSLPDNVARLSLSPRGKIRQLVATSLDQEESLREVVKYRAIVRAVATGQTRRNEIAQCTGLTNDAGLRDKLTRLVDLGYLATRTNVDARPNEPATYAVADPAVRFHHRFVEPHLALLDRADPHDVWTTHVAPRFASFVGLAFEHVATQAYDRLRRARGYPLVERWGRWGGSRPRRPVARDRRRGTADRRPCHDRCGQVEHEPDRRRRALPPPGHAGARRHSRPHLGPRCARADRTRAARRTTCTIDSTLLAALLPHPTTSPRTSARLPPGGARGWNGDGTRRR